LLEGFGENDGEGEGVRVWWMGLCFSSSSGRGEGEGGGGGGGEGGVVVRDVLFFPDQTRSSRHGPFAKLIGYLDGASRSLDVAVYSITDNRIRDALRRAHGRGVAVRVISDTEQSKSLGSDVLDLAREGIPTRLNDGRNGGGAPPPPAHGRGGGGRGAAYVQQQRQPQREEWGPLMHHKFAVVDGKTVVTGSYNFSRSACDKNNESVVVLESRSVAGKFAGEFERLWAAFEG